MQGERLLRTIAIACVLGLSAVGAGEADESPWNAATFKGLELRGIGPALMSGRIADAAIDPRNPSTWYVAVGSGNLWKTTNSGTTWKPIFDDQGSYSIGTVVIDPNQPGTIWLGTGENVGGRHVGYGDGVYRSDDGGANWKRMGLESSEHIGRIVVDPRDSKVVYVAAQGPLWSGGGDRGLFKTTDRGTTWNKILGGGPYTGVNDVVMDPRNPDVLYASTHQRLRSVAALINGGPESGIHKSTDGGATWRQLSEGLPGGGDGEGPEGKKDAQDMGRIGLAISPQQPDVVYAAIELAHRKGGFFRSADGGASWEKRSDKVAGGTGPHYYQEIFASPHRFDRVYFTDMRLAVSEDGGSTFRNIESRAKHVDNHALAFNPNDPDYLLAGCDGGLYESWDLGQTWKFIANLPVTQFYKLAIDNDEPFYNVYGGTQDNNTQGGPSRTDNVHGIRNSDWFVTLGGDGHQPAVDPENPDIVYSEWQQGNLVRFDRKTGEIVYIQPQPAEDEPAERFNWDSPILISPHDPARLYFASQRVWRSDDRGDRWRPISGDLSRGLDRLELPLMDRVWSFDSLWDVYAMSMYGNVTSLAQSPLDEKLIYAGTDDGLIQVTEDGGQSWRKVDRLPGVDEFFFVNDVKADLHDADTVYAVVDQHKVGDFEPYVFKSSNRGRSWKSLAGGLPDRHVAWRIVQDHVNPQLLFLGTEFGVFFTVDGGARWTKLEGGAPNIPFRDLAIQRRENDLVGATFGRGFFILDDYTPLRELTPDDLAAPARLFPVRKAWWYVERETLSRVGKGTQGDGFYTAPNPPFGAVFTYYLAEDLETRKAARREREKEIEDQGGDTPYPGWEELRRERLEEDPSIVLIVRDDADRIVRRLAGPTKAGFHRVAWDLRHPSPEPWTAKGIDLFDWQDRRGYLAGPGRYTVTLAKRVEGRLSLLGTPQPFDVVPLGTGTLEGASPEETAKFWRELGKLQRAVKGAATSIDATLERVGAIQQALMRSPADNLALDDEARAFERRLHDLRLTLVGEEKRFEMGDPGPLPIAARLDVAEYGTRNSTYGPTPTHRDSFRIAAEAFDDLRAELDRLLRVQLPAFEKRLDTAQVPWTPGR